MRAEATLAAEAASAARARTDRDRAIRNAGSRIGTGALPQGDLTDDVVNS